MGLTTELYEMPPLIIHCFMPLTNRRPSHYNIGMNIVLNGQPQTLSGPTSVSTLVEQLGYAGKRIAVERNGEIVPKSTYLLVQLEPGDRLEIVVAVGGG